MALSLQHVSYDRLDSGVTAGKAANDQAEDECWQLQEQDLQLRRQVSKASLVAATECLHASRNEASLQGHLGSIAYKAPMLRLSFAPSVASCKTPPLAGTAKDSKLIPYVVESMTLIEQACC